MNDSNKTFTYDLVFDSLLISFSQDEVSMILEKYPDEVTVYSIGDISKELCGGPHVTSTGCLGTFKIKKEEASSQGVRRIKAVLE